MSRVTVFLATIVAFLVLCLVIRGPLPDPHASKFTQSWQSDRTAATQQDDEYR